MMLICFQATQKVIYTKKDALIPIRLKFVTICTLMSFPHRLFGQHDDIK